LEKLTIIVGLGNPGRKYESTRHNVGFMTVDLIAQKFGIKVNRLKHRALTGEGRIDGERVLLAKPQTFMNLSGESVREIVEYYKVPVENLIVIYDDADLQAGVLRIRPKGSSGTHNGMKSVIYHLRSDSFPRIRIGIGRAPEGWDLADYVLGEFGGNEAEKVAACIRRAAEAAAVIVTDSVEKAMSRYNGDAGRQNGDVGRHTDLQHSDPHGDISKHNGDTSGKQNGDIHGKNAVDGSRPKDNCSED
jgi:PTH1 family peptidyl-tRNA hydrolase